MPELPEVETVRRDLSRHLIGEKVRSVEVFFPGSVQVSPQLAKDGDFSSQLIGQAVTGINRRGKLLIVSFSSGLYLLAHLKMTGQLVYVSASGGLVAGGHSLPEDDDNPDTIGRGLPNRFTRVKISFGSGDLFFNDLRKFGYLKLATLEEMEGVVSSGYGLEPGRNFDKEDFRAAITRPSSAIKAVLLDQKIIAGLGNIYVDESLFAAGIRPERRSSSLSEDEIYRLWESIDRIIAAAIEARGTTFRDYRDAEGKKGNFSAQLLVYGRAGEPCAKCGAPILKKKQGGRGTHFCEHCQK